MPKKVWVRLLLLIAFIIPVFLCFPVWRSQRSFPTVPVFGSAIELHLFGDIFLLLVLLCFALWFVIKEDSYGGLGFFMVYVICCCLDQTRIQPFYFEIAFIIGFYYLFRKKYTSFKIAFLLLMAGTYIWSGLHKSNPVFYELWLGGLNKHLPFIPLFLRQTFTYLVPFIEMSFGLALLFNKTRKLGIIALALMHAMVIVTLLVSGGGYAVIPLNSLNVILLFMLCYNFDWSLQKLFKSELKLKLIAFYVIILPALNLVGLWDHLLSFSYFSGKPDYCNIIVQEDNLDNLPPDIKTITAKYNDYYYINVNRWSVKYTKALCYPEERVYNYLQDYIETFTGENSTQLQYYKK